MSVLAFDNLANTPYRRAAHAYWKQGWTNPIPVEGKHPPVTGYTGANGASVSWADMQAWLDDDSTFPNVALRLQHGIVGIDVDAYDGKTGDRSLSLAEETLGPLPATWTSTSRGQGQPSRIHFFSVPVNTVLKGVEGLFVKTFGEHVDILHHGHRYAMVAPSHSPKTDSDYVWYDPEGQPVEGAPMRSEIAPLPEPWLEFFSAASHVTTTKPLTAGQPREDRRFTQEQAEAYCKVQMDRLRAATNGTINNTLNDTAILLGHFVPAFWSEESVTKWLLDAQRRPEHDADETTARGTIRSGLGAGMKEPYVKVEPEPVKAEPEFDAVEAMLARMLDRDAMTNLPEPDPLIADFLDKGTVARLNGASNVGKSFVALDMAGCIGNNIPWHGQQVTQGKVVYLVAEGLAGIRKRVHAWEEHHGRKMDNVLFYPAAIQVNDAEWAVFVEVCKRIGPVFIVLDTQARVTAGVEENSNSEMGVIVRNIDALKVATGACVMLVHHTGHEGTRARGASAMIGAMDHEFVVDKTGDGTIRMKTTKQKDREYAEDKRFRMKVVGERPDDFEQDHRSVVLVDAGDEVETDDFASVFDEGQTRLFAVLDLMGQGTKAQIQKAFTTNDSNLHGPRSVPSFYRAWKALESRHHVMPLADQKGHWVAVPPEERIAQEQQ